MSIFGAVTTHCWPTGDWRSQARQAFVVGTEIGRAAIAEHIPPFSIDSEVRKQLV